MNSELSLREALCDIGKRIYQREMVAANDGNFSVRLGENEFLCTPTGTSKGFMTPDMICKVDAKGNLIEENPHGLKPSSEFKMHLKIYELRPDVNSVVHAHPLHATAYAICNKVLDKQIMPEATIGLGIVPVAEYAAPSTNALAESLEPFVNEYEAVLLANHGAVTYGNSLIDAYYKMESLEFYAKLVYLSSSIGEVKELDDEKVKELIDLRLNTYKLTGKHPLYKCMKNQ